MHSRRVDAYYKVYKESTTQETFSHIPHVHVNSKVHAHMDNNMSMHNMYMHMYMCMDMCM